MKASQGLCLNIGCANSVADGWLNVDSSPTLRISTVPLVGKYLVRAVNSPITFKNAIYGDIVRGLKLDPGSCDLVFASHVLEHLAMADFDDALRNMYTYLRPGGILRVIVPDLRDYVEGYRREREDDATANEAAARFMTLSGIGSVGSRSSLRLRLREALSNSRHQTMWDEPSLAGALATHGFKNIRTCHYGEWGDERFGAIEKQKRHQRALCLEATK